MCPKVVHTMEQNFGQASTPSHLSLKTNSSSMIKEAGKGLHYIALSDEELLLTSTEFFSHRYLKVCAPFCLH